MKNMHDARDSAGPPHKDLRVFSTRTCEFSVSFMAKGPLPMRSSSAPEMGGDAGLSGGVGGKVVSGSL